MREFFIYLSREHPGGALGHQAPHQAAAPDQRARLFHQPADHVQVVRGRALIAESPMARLATPPRKSAPIQPFATEHIEALLAAARASPVPKRDVAILTLLLDTGCGRASVTGFPEAGPVEWLNI
jgi:site-specific recombinase XerD